MGDAVGLVYGGGGTALSPPSPSGDGSRPQVQRASLKLYDSSPTTGGRKLDGTDRQHRLPVQPQGSHHRQVGEMGAQTRVRREKGVTAAVHRARAVQADAGDVLRRHRQTRRQCRRRGGEAVLLLRGHREDRGQRQAGPAAGGVHLGADHQLPGLRHPGQREVHPVLAGRHPDPGDLQCLAAGDAGGEAASRTPRRARWPCAAPTGWWSATSLASVAYAEYGDADAVAELATFNRIDDPMRIPLGSVLMLPSAAELAVVGGLSR